MTDIKDLKVGDEVTLTIKTTVYSAHPGYVPSVEFQFGNGSWMQFDHGDIISGFVTIDRAPRPLPTEDGVYIAAYNAEDPGPSGAQLHILEGGKWKIFTGSKVREDSLGIEYGTRWVHENLGGLVRLVPEQ